MIGRLAPDVGLDHSQSAEIGLELPGVPLGDLPGVPVLSARRDFQLVVALVGVGGEVAHVGDVDDVAHPPALPAQYPLERVGEDVGPHVADVLGRVDGRPARVHADLGRTGRGEFRYLAGKGVE